MFRSAADPQPVYGTTSLRRHRAVATLTTITTMSSPTTNLQFLNTSINLLRGWPSTETLPFKILSEAAARTLAQPSTSVPGLQYGDDAGFKPLRSTLSAWLSATYGQSRSNQSEDSLCITAGASLGLANVLQSFTDPSFTQAVWIVVPCYFLACPIFEDAGFAGRLKAVPEGDEGVDLQFLQKGLERFPVQDERKPASTQTSMLYFFE